MRFYGLFILLSSFIFGAHIDAAASSSQIGAIRKSAYTNTDCLYLEQALDTLLEQGAYDEAYDLCRNAQDCLPEKYLGLIRLTLGKLSLVSTERGMPRNVSWAKWHFEQALKTVSSTTKVKQAALDQLKSLEAENKKAEDVFPVTRSQAKRSQRAYSASEPNSKEARVLNSCFVCKKSFETSRGLKIHQTLMGHKSGEASTLESPVFPSDDSEIEQVLPGLVFEELTQEECELTCSLCKRTFSRRQALRLHQSRKGH